jgi:nucleotide-binding universal stress UspA family protein
MFKKILVAVDETKLAARVVDVAAAFATQLAADVAVVHVIDESRAYILDLGVLDDVLMSSLRGDGLAALDAAYRRMPLGLKVQRMLVRGDPSEMIIATAQNWQADLIVLGNDSRGRLAHFLLGSTADSVIRRAPCPVIAVRSTGNAAHVQPAAHAAHAAHAVAGA